MGIWIRKKCLAAEYTNERGTHGNNRKPTQETQDARKWFEAYSILKQTSAILPQPRSMKSPIHDPTDYK